MVITTRLMKNGFLLRMDGFLLILLSILLGVVLGPARSIHEVASLHSSAPIDLSFSHGRLTFPAGSLLPISQFSE